MKQSELLRRVRDGNQKPIKRSHKAQSVAKVDGSIWPVRRLVTEREDLSMGQDQKQYIAGRIVGGCSLHAAEVPGRCQPNYNQCVDDV